LQKQNDSENQKTNESFLGISLEFPILLAYDKQLMQPGCVLLQVAYGGCQQAAHFFDPKKWLLAPTKDMKVYQVNSMKELQKIVLMSGAIRV